jgi:hypothetical protein
LPRLICPEFRTTGINTGESIRLSRFTKRDLVAMWVVGNALHELVHRKRTVPFYCCNQMAEIGLAAISQFELGVM